MSRVMAVFFILLCGSSMAFDTMSWSPRTPAGGAFVGDSNFWIRQAVMAKWGSEIFFIAPNESKNTLTQTSTTKGGDRRYGVFQSIDDNGNVILFNANGDPIEKKDDEIVVREAGGSFYYFSPQTTHFTSTQINKVRARKR